MISNKLCNICLLYRSANQNSDKFENFVNNLNLTLESITEKKPLFNNYFRWLMQNITTGVVMTDLTMKGVWNTGLVSSGANLTSWGEGASLALVGNPSSDGVTIKIPYGVDVLHWPAWHPIFSY